MKKRDSGEGHLQWVKIIASFLLLLVAGMLLYHTIQEESGLWKKQDSSCMAELEEDCGEGEGIEENLFFRELPEIWNVGKYLMPDSFFRILSWFLENLGRLWEGFRDVLFWIL